ncbi:MAG: bifunctional histidinol-phosphatase/imidazoleglycerol-phosphate dehydratase HisB [Gammaproteobacteria bacterium]|nr:bifunctional histidinol-phosphatase/imidazoleglycerol-phosphate dehydratase HisB [Gammaproteobacteria bacterium]
MSTAVLFIDRDGTLIEEPPDQQVDSFTKFRLTRGVIPALLRLRAAGFRFVMVTNQDGLGTPAFPHEQFEGPQRLLLDLLESQGISFDAVLLCPHFPEQGCDCRKPATALVDAWVAEHPLDRSRSLVIGDRDSDLELARRLGLGALRFDQTDPQAWADIAARLALPRARRARCERRTRETAIEAEVDLGAEEPVEVVTGIGFFDHMLEQIARHGGFALRLRCTGDLHVDEHHTIEDCALALGAALAEALGERRGIARYGFVLPMDEARAQVAIDLSGRPYASFAGRCPGERAGALPVEMVPHFFRSLAEALRAAIHIEVQGDNTHHMIEACFKGVGRALRQAIRVEGTGVPSSKGVL